MENICVNDYVVDFMSNRLDYGLYTTINANNENVILQVIRGEIEDYLQVITCQNNNCLKITCYYEDGTIIETFKK